MDLSKRVSDVLPYLLLRLKSRSARELPAFMGNCPTINHTFNPYLPSWCVLLQGNEDVQSVPDMILFYFWSESRELGCRCSSGFSCVIPVVETFSSDKFAFRMPSNISDGAHLRKLPTTLTRWLLPQKSPTTDFRQDSKCGSDQKCCE